MLFKRNKYAEGKMKRLLSLILALTVLLSLSGCGLNSIPDGYTEKDEHFEKNAIQDTVDFANYKYDSIDRLRNSECYEYYKTVSEGDIENLKGYFENFVEWLNDERLAEYSFDTSCISEGDYYLLETEEGKSMGDGYFYGKYDIYRLYFFDAETLTLYFIHADVK